MGIMTNIFKKSLIKMNREFGLYINNILLLYLWCVLNNEISYTEELALSLIYIVLFIIISEKSRDVIRLMIVNNTIKLISYYEKLIYLKLKIMIKNLKLLNVLVQKKNLKNIINIINFELKKKKQNYLDNKKKINTIRKVYYLFFLLLSKIYR